MLGIILISISSLFNELATSLGKYEVRKREESIYTMGFLNLFWGTIILLIIAWARNNFIFSTASLPTFIIRAILEILQTHVAILAVIKADRSTFGFLRIITIPLLLTIDIFLGYNISVKQEIGITLMVISLIFIFINHGIKKNGAGLVLFTAINSALTISLFKYNISHFNSVEAEQSIMHLILMVYLFTMGLFVAKENSFKAIKKPLLFLQSSFMGLAGVTGSFAFSFAPTSIINTAERSLSILFAAISGNIYFHEKHFLIKIVSLTFIIAGLILLTT